MGLCDNVCDLKPFLNRVATGGLLTREEAEQAFLIMMSGQATPTQIGGFLMGLRVRGETIDEICGAVSAMRRKMLRVHQIDDAIDIVGTGGDQSGSYNVSTASAFVVAGAGVKVAKHGNRALSSKSGAADALQALGINIDAPPDLISRCVREVGLGFMFAPAHHQATRHVGPSRVELGTRTIFNLLGPLSNPAGVKKHLIGVFAREWIEPIAKVLRELGSQTLWVVHGSGMDELTTAGETEVVEIRDGQLRHFFVNPQDVGLTQVAHNDLRGGDGKYNAQALRRVLAGEPSAYRDIVLLNAAAAFVIADKVTNLRDGVALASETIDQGKANHILERLIDVSNGKV